MWKSKRYFAPEGEEGGGGGPAVIDAPAADPAPADPAPTAPAPAATATPATPEPAGDWNPKWRELMAGGDEKELKQLTRYASPLEVWKKARALEGRLSSGEVKPVLAKDATPEQIAEYRKAHGIPEAPDKYDIKGVKIDDDDKPMIDKIVASMHGANATPEQVKAAISVLPEMKRQALEARAEADHNAASAAEEALRAEWGADFKRHMNLIGGVLDLTGSPNLKQQLIQGRLADGTPIGSSPEAMRFLLNLALIQNPAGVVVPSSGGDQMQGVADEIGKIEKVMKENRPAYNKDEAMQARYRELLGVRETLKSRS